MLKISVKIILMYYDFEKNVSNRVDELILADFISIDELLEKTLMQIGESIEVREHREEIFGFDTAIVEHDINVDFLRDCEYLDVVEFGLDELENVLLPVADVFVERFEELFALHVRPVVRAELIVQMRELLV